MVVVEFQPNFCVTCYFTAHVHYSLTQLIVAHGALANIFEILYLFVSPIVRGFIFSFD